MAGKKGFGTIIEYSIDAGANWVKIANVTKIRPFGVKADSIDVSDMDSPSSFREKLAGLLDGGQINLDLNYDNGLASHKWLVDNAGVSYLFRITFTGANAGKDKVKWAGFVDGVTPEVPHDNKQTCTATAQISGPPTWS